MRRRAGNLKRFLSIFLLVIAALYFYKFGGKEFLTSKITFNHIASNLDLLFPVIMAFLGAHGLWHNNTWGAPVSQFTLGLIAFPSFKFLVGHLSFTAGLANFVFPLDAILFLLLIFV